MLTEVLAVSTGRTCVHIGMPEMCFHKWMAAARLWKNLRAPEKKKFPATMSVHTCHTNAAQRVVELCIHLCLRRAAMQGLPSAADGKGVGVEVHEERPQDLLVGLLDARPQCVRALDNVQPAVSTPQHTHHSAFASSLLSGRRCCSSVRNALCFESLNRRERMSPMAGPPITRMISAVEPPVIA